MGNFNPHAPVILGEEWVAVRDEDITFSPAVNIAELGHGFTTTASRVLATGRFYVNTPSGLDGDQTFFINVYPTGNEALSGPVQQVIIPVNSGNITGGPDISLNNASTVQQALANPSDGASVQVFGGAGSNGSLSMFFATGSYGPDLTGKRILGMNFLYVATGLWSTEDPGLQNAFSELSTRTNAAIQARFDGLTVESPNRPNILRTMRLGDIDATTLNGGDGDCMPWTYPALVRFEASSPNRLFLHLSFSNAALPGGDFLLLHYAAMQILYCEEQRVAVGGRRYAGIGGYVLGQNAVTMRDLNGTASPTLGAGEYTATIASGDPGALRRGQAAAATYPILNGLRQIEQFPPHPAVRVDIPFPMDTTAIGQTFTATPTNILPQLSLHTASAPWVEVNSYGRLAIGQVYGSYTASQDIYDTGFPVATYPWVRFYARRFGNTAVPLTIFNAALGVSASITPTDFDDLEEIVDGWRQVNLLLAPPPSMGGGATREWSWSATGEKVGNRWEVLGVCAPALSGIPGNNLNTVPTGDQLGTTTYGAPTAGSTINMSYLGPYNQDISSTSLVGVGTMVHNNNASVAPTVPVGFAAGDLLLLLAAIRNSGTGTVNTPTGYTVLAGSGLNFTLFGKVADGTETGATVTFSGGAANATTSAQFAAFRGAGLSVAGLTTQLNGSAQNIDFPALPFTGPQLELFLGWKQDDWTSVAAPVLSGLAAISDGSSTLGDDQGMLWAYALRTTGSGTLTWTITGGASAISRGYTLSLPMAPIVVADTTADAEVIFSQLPPAISGFGVTPQSQPLIGIGLDCGVPPCCIPTDINYNQLGWDAPLGSVVAIDTFTRTVTGWGTDDSGFTYTDSGGTVPGNYIVNGTAGTHILDSVNVGRHSFISGSYFNLHQQVEVRLNVMTAGASARSALMGNVVDVNNFDLVDFRWASATGMVELVVASVVAGTQTNQTNIGVGSFQANETWVLVADFNNGRIRAKAWMLGDPEPAFYQAEGAASFLSGGFGIRSIRSTGNTNNDLVMSYDNYEVGPSDWNFGYYELQRKDIVDTDWQTIMKATSPTTLTFNDYEARVGLATDYRLRNVNVAGFVGDWSSMLTITSAAPGVSGGCLDEGHVMIFTSNERQDGAINLAYSNAWEGMVEENFTFPESGMVQLQAMYDRDYVTAFHPTERGGDQFTRNILVQAAAISPPTLSDFTSLRDMAWADVSYICVRDEAGNKWLATVLVPSGRVVHFRKLYFAEVRIIETTATSSPVDPS